MTDSQDASLSPSQKLHEHKPPCLGDQLPSDGSPPLPSVNFDCSICLDQPQDPVVTMCGHLFCWSCLHRWITIQPLLQECPCPVCKACVKDKIIPLYGRGKEGFMRTDLKTDDNFDTPRRPSAQQSYIRAANLPQSARYQHQSLSRQGTHANGGGYSTCLVTASGLVPALFGIHMVASPSSSSVEASLNLQSRSLPVGAVTWQQQQQQQRVNANGQQEFVLYWFLFLLGCFASVCFLLF